MTFLSPSSLWLLGSIPVLVLIHTLRLRRDPVTVPSLLLWQQAQLEGTGNRLSRRVQDWLSLLLQIVVATLVVIALARPAQLRPGTGSGIAVLVLDASASMKARDGGGDRMERAVDAARSVVDGLGPATRVAVVVAGPPHRALVPVTLDHGAVERALGDVEAAELEGDPAGALAMAAGMIRDVPGSSVHLFSDLAFDRDPLEAFPDLPLFVHPVAGLPGDPEDAGDDGGNAGIVAFEVRRDPSSRHDWEVLVEVQNSHPTERVLDVTLVLDDVLLDVRPWTVPAGRSVARVFRGLPVGPGVLEARLETEDALAADDVAHLVIEASSRRRVALVGEPHPALLRALEADPTVVLDRVPTAEYLEHGGLQARHAVAVFSRFLPETLPPGGVLLVEPPPRGSRTPLGEGMGAVAWNRFHPLTRLLDLGGLVVESVGWPALPGGLVSLAEVAGHPLVLAGQRDLGRLAVLNVDLRTTDLPSRAAFPILISAALEWLSAEGASAVRHGIRAGQPIVLSWSAPPEWVRVRDPGGDVAEPPVKEATATYADTGRTGLYAVRWPGTATLVAVNLASATETDLRPRWSPPPEPGTRGDAGSAPYHRELGLPFAAAALAVAAGEWWLYRRREAW